MEQDRARWDTRAKQLVQQAQETQATLCHSWLDLLARNGKLLRLFQQNVDGLEAQYPALHAQTIHLHAPSALGNSQLLRKDNGERSGGKE